MNIDYISYQEQLQDEQWNTKRLNILRRDKFCCKMCGSKGDKEHPLNVHHRYYKYGAEAWDYNDDALITLCCSCHELIHRTLPPLIYHTNGVCYIRMHFTPCIRCNGAGWFREYNHVQGGICFRCQGQRLEELINKEKVDPNLYLSQKEEVFDLLKPEPDETIIESIYQEASNHFWQKEEHSDLDKAEGLYLQAALNGHAQAQNDYARLISLIRPEAKDVILRFSLYSAMQGIYQAQQSIANILKKDSNDKKHLYEQWNALACRSEAKRYEQIGHSLSLCSTEDDISSFMKKLSYKETRVISEVFLDLSDSQENENNIPNDELPF